MSRCENCGLRIDTDDMYCTSCGKKIARDEQRSKDIPKFFLLKKIALSYYVALALDIITIGSGILIFGSYTNYILDSSASWNSYTPIDLTSIVLIISGLLIATIQGFIFESQFKDLYNMSNQKNRVFYLFLPTFHAIILLVLFDLVSSLSSFNYFNLLGVLFGNLIVCELFVGFIFLYKRFSKYINSLPPTNNYDALSEVPHKEKQKQKQFKREVEKERVIEGIVLQNRL